MAIILFLKLRSTFFNVSDLPQSLHENKRKPNEDRATQDITKTTVLIVKTQSVDEDSNNKKKKPIKEVLLRKIDSLSDHERSSDEDTKPTKKTHLHASVVTHANNGVTHGRGGVGVGGGGRSSADEKRRLDEIEEQLKITRIENDRLRTQLSSLDKKFAVREAEDLRSKKDHDEQLKHWMASANRQLEETNRHKQAYEKTKEELGRVKGEHERSLKEATAKAAELSKQLAEKEKLIAAMREKHENGGGGGGVSKTDRELEVERNLRLKLTEELEEANRKILSLTSQVEAHEKAVDAHRRSVQELGNETRLRKKQEKLLEEAKEMVNTLGKQIEEKDRQLKAEKERCRRSNSQEQEQAKKLQDDAKGKLIAVTQKLEETAKELENSKSELSKEKAQKRNQETMLLEANKKISELSRLLNERDGELAAVKLEHEKAVRRRSSNPFETQSKYTQRCPWIGLTTWLGWIRLGL